jgi:hypothetical protein
MGGPFVSDRFLKTVCQIDLGNLRIFVIVSSLPIYTYAFIKEFFGQIVSPLLQIQLGFVVIDDCPGYVVKACLAFLLLSFAFK